LSSATPRSPAFPGAFAAKTALPLLDAPGDELRFSVAGGTFIAWTATYGADGSSLQELATGGSVDDPDANPAASPEALTAAEFATPPAGDWIVQVFVRFADGDATYWWHVTVE
jgi:hypothetical protein